MPPGLRQYSMLLRWLALLCAPVACSQAPGEDPPRLHGLVLITIDTLRADRVGAYGASRPTPALDRIAAEGALVEQAVAPSPITAPSHASLFTGVYPWRHRVLTNSVPLADGHETLAEIVSARGVATAAFVSSAVLDRRYGWARGFDEYSFEPTFALEHAPGGAEAFYARGELATGAAMRWVTQRVADDARPFFVWLHLFDPHRPYAPPAGYALDPMEPVDINRSAIPRRLRRDPKLERLARDYAGEVAYADAQVGRLMDRLQALGVLDQVAVIVTADHGEAFGEHGFQEHASALYEEQIRIPLLVRAPGIPAGRRLAGPAQLEDLLPTALSLIGAPTPAGIDGVDLLPWLQGAVEDSPRAWALGVLADPEGDARDTYFQRRWPEKWIGTADGAGRRYDLAHDPDELRGVSPGEPPRGLLGALGEGHELVPRAPLLDERSRQALEALGYGVPEPR